MAKIIKSIFNKIAGCGESTESTISRIDSGMEKIAENMIAILAPRV